MTARDAFSREAPGVEDGMTLEIDALRRLIAQELVGAGVRIPASELSRVSAAILAEAVRISVEWVEAGSVF